MKNIKKSSAEKALFREVDFALPWSEGVIFAFAPDCEFPVALLCPLVVAEPAVFDDALARETLAALLIQFDCEEECAAPVDFPVPRIVLPWDLAAGLFFVFSTSTGRLIMINSSPAAATGG